MFCPEVIVINTDWLMFTRYGAADYKSRCAPLAERLNIFRYELILRRKGRCLRLNKNGRAWLNVSNIIWRISKLRCRHEWYKGPTKIFCLKCLRDNPTRDSDHA